MPHIRMAKACRFGSHLSGSWVRTAAFGLAVLVALAGGAFAQTTELAVPDAGTAAPIGTDAGVPEVPSFPPPEMVDETDLVVPPDTFDPNAPIEEEAPAEPGTEPSPKGEPLSPTTQSSAITEPESVTVNESTLYADLQIPHGIQSDGAYRYSYPIDVPKFRGLEPQISLDYKSLGWSHKDVDNVLGSGWRIGGFSKIERRDTDGGLPPSDRYDGVFRLDGEALLACKDSAATNPFTGRYGQGFETSAPSASCSSGGNFAAQHENYARILLTASRGNPDAKFIVWRPNGVRLTYETISAISDKSIEGVSSEKRNVLAANTWLLTEVRDTHQGAGANVVSYGYSFNTGDVSFSYRPDYVKYNNYRISFNYTKPDKVVSTYQTGPTSSYPKGRQEWRLHSIHVNYGTTKIRAYDIGHSFTDQGSDSHYLRFIKQYGNNWQTTNGLISGGAGLPATRFTYDLGRTFSDGERAFGQGLLLQKIEGSKGGSWDISYLESTNGAVAVNDSGHQKRYLVRSIVEKSGRENGGPGRKTDYRFTDSVYITVRKRSLGFRKVEAFLPRIRGESSEPYIANFYDNTSIKRNGALTQRVYYEGSTYSERIVYEQDVQDAGNGPFYSRLSGIRRFSRETDESDGSRRETIRLRQFTHNLYGQIDRIRDFGYVDSEGNGLIGGERSTTFLEFKQKIDGASWTPAITLHLEAKA